MTGAFELSGDLAGSDDVVTWTVPEDQPADGWRLDAQGVVGNGPRLALRDDTGRTVAATISDELGSASLRDLRLPSGPLQIWVSGGPLEGASPYRLAARGDVGPGDPEPDDDPDRAAPLTLGAPTHGRLTGPTDVDVFRLPAQEVAAPRLMDIKLIWRSGLDRELCLRTLDGWSLQCRRGSDGINLRNVLLADDRFVLSIQGDARSESIPTSCASTSRARPPRDGRRSPTTTSLPRTGSGTRPSRERRSMASAHPRTSMSSPPARPESRACGGST